MVSAIIAATNEVKHCQILLIFVLLTRNVDTRTIVLVFKTFYAQCLTTLQILLPTWSNISYNTTTTNHKWKFTISSIKKNVPPEDKPLIGALLNLIGRPDVISMLACVLFDWDERLETRWKIGIQTHTPSHLYPKDSTITGQRLVVCILNTWRVADFFGRFSR